MRLHSRHSCDPVLGPRPIYVDGLQTASRSLRLRGLGIMAGMAARQELDEVTGTTFDVTFCGGAMVIKGKGSPEVHVPLLLSEAAHSLERPMIALATKNGAGSKCGTARAEDVYAMWLLVVEGDETAAWRHLAALTSFGVVRAGFQEEYLIGRVPFFASSTAAMFEVYSRPRYSRDPATPHQVLAAKVFGAQGRRRFEPDEEIMLLASVQGHPNVVRFHGAFFHNGMQVLLTQLCPWGDLHDDVKRDGVYMEDKALALTSGLLSALAHVHGCGVVHHDVKPENVLLGAGGWPLLTDFGIAAHVSDPKAMSRCCGSAGYAAPEVFLLPPRPHGPKVDVFGGGAVLFFMLFAPTPLFEGTSLAEVRTSTLECAIHFPPARAISSPLRWLLQRLLAKDPWGRPTASEALEALEAVGAVARPAPREADAETLALRDGRPCRIVGILRQVYGALRRARSVAGAPAALPAGPADERQAESLRLLGDDEPLNRQTSGNSSCSASSNSTPVAGTSSKPSIHGSKGRIRLRFLVLFPLLLFLLEIPKLVHLVGLGNVLAVALSVGIGVVVETISARHGI